MASSRASSSGVPRELSRRRIWRNVQKWLEMDEELVETPEYDEKWEKEPEDDDRPIDS